MQRSKRCAVYTRKSSEEGLEQEFNSLHAQREACEAYIKSQQHEGWRLIPDAYDDGGISGGTMERPGLQRLLSDVRAGRVDVIVVYKVDRLSRALSDFAKMVDLFDEYDVSFVSVTQQFNTTTSMGRLTLNVLLSFAQFEREVTGERIRDKIAASKKKGMWMGGLVPLGYDSVERKLAINEKEAEDVCFIFKRFTEIKCVRTLKQELDEKGITSKHRTSKAGNKSGGSKLSRGAIYKILGNRIYLGDIVHKGTCHPGEHEAIIEQNLWDEAQTILDQNRVSRRRQTKAKEPSLLAGFIYDASGQRMTPSHAVKGDRRYRYYEARSEGNKPLRLPAQGIEDHVGAMVREFLIDVSSCDEHLFNSEQSDLTNARIREASIHLIEIWPSQSPGAIRAFVLEAIRQITIRDASIDLEISCRGLLEYLIGRKATAALEVDPSESVKRSTPYRFQRYGNQRRIITQGQSAQPRPNAVLIRALGKAWGWRNRIERDGLTIKDIATVETATPRYIRRLLQLAWLAPDIMEAIMDGRQLPELTLDAFRNAVPLTWKDQEKFLDNYSS